MFQKYFQHMPNGHILKTLARFDHIVNVFSMILKFFIVIIIQLFGHMSGTFQEQPWKYLKCYFVNTCWTNGKVTFEMFPECIWW